MVGVLTLSLGKKAQSLQHRFRMVIQSGSFSSSGNIGYSHDTVLLSSLKTVRDVFFIRTPYAKTFRLGSVCFVVFVFVFIFAMKLSFLTQLLIQICLSSLVVTCSKFKASSDLNHHSTAYTKYLNHQDQVFTTQKPLQ